MIKSAALVNPMASKPCSYREMKGHSSGAEVKLMRAVVIFAVAFIIVLCVNGILGVCQSRQAGVHFFSTLRGVHIAGYQGWFDCPGDGAGAGWGHWFRPNADPRDPNSLAIDIWPDTSELGPDELCPTGFKLSSGAPAYLFSNVNPKTVARHFQWMAQYGIDGAAMQRFVSILSDDASRRHFDKVLLNARSGAEANHRGFFVLYDVTGVNGGVALQAIAQDWVHLTRDLHLAESPSYIYDKGRPVVAVWGFGFKGRDITPDQASAIIHFLRTANVPATVLGGVPASWRTLSEDASSDTRWAAVYRSFDIISPWSVGRFGDDKGADGFARLAIIPDIAETRRLGIEYMPVVFPGFSWHHGAGRATHSPLNVFSRRCGEFYKRQINNAVKAGAVTLFTAMFDEINEGTAIFKLVASKLQESVGTDLFALDADGCRQATSDMYLRIAGNATVLLRSR